MLAANKQSSPTVESAEQRYKRLERDRTAHAVGKAAEYQEKKIC